MNQNPNAKGTHSLLIVDDHPLVRDGLKLALNDSEFTPIIEAASLSEAIAQIAHYSPDALVVDLNLPDGSGLEIVRWVRGHEANVAIVVLTMNESDQALVAAYEAGASAYVLKSAPIGELLSALRHATLVPQSFIGIGLGAALKHKEKNYGLSVRELEVLRHLPTELTAREIANVLFISEATVKTHIASIYQKLGVSNRSAAVTFSIREGLVSL